MFANDRSFYPPKALFELREFCILATYLWVCFAAIVFLKYAILQAQGIAYLPFGIAAIKAVVSAKFLMLGRVLGVTGTRIGERLFVTILRKTLALLILLVVLTMIEEVALAAIHGRPVSTALADVAGGTAMEIAASVFIMLLILIPYVGLRSHIGRAPSGTR
jgi:hypothetical protein